MNSRTKVEQHLIKQKARSVHEDGSACMYRGAEGRMCAAGCLIPDELYTPNLERRAISLLVANGQMNIFPSDITAEELKKWQNYHDGLVCFDFGGPYYSYKAWIEGDEAHHPTRFKEALAAFYEPAEDAA